MIKKKFIIWILRIIAAAILLQTLFFKFNGAEESIYIFSTLGVEPYGRIGTGIAELIVVILILIPRTTWIGALCGLVIMTGAIFSHLLVLGIQIKGDGGLLFGLAVIVFVCCLGLLHHYRKIFFNFLKIK
ncbi:DoxX family protein [Flavobacterium sp.]|uniref:DoxX family protein n=1 Tax=Flavobacterium sp. TaxID=239 RepID=UPI003264DD7C